MAVAAGHDGGTLGHPQIRLAQDNAFLLGEGRAKFGRPQFLSPRRKKRK
jgi:hypothetical protein